jgi:hypothetical protein
MLAAWWLATMVAPAAAQDLLVHPDWLLEPRAGEVWQNGVGSPAVAYDPRAGLWVMFFETPFGPADPPGGDCRAGRWGIGRATSPDGLIWTADADLVLTPAPDTYYGCIAAHPDVMFDGTTWHLWFKAHQANTVCQNGELAPPWGCSPVTGVGYASSADGVTFSIQSEPALSLFAFGYPSVAQVQGTYRMLVAYDPVGSGAYELWSSEAPAPGGPWTLPQLVLGPGFSPWAADELFNPSWTCVDPTTATSAPYTLYGGGRVKDGSSGVIVEQAAALGLATSSDLTTWDWDPASPLFSWNLDPTLGEVQRDWRHWDAVRVGDEHLLFFAQKDDLGRNRIGLAYTYDAVQTALDGASAHDRVCGAAPTADTAPDTDDTPETPPEDTPADSGHDPYPTLPVEPRGCGCASPGAPTSPMAALLPALAALVDRLRRARRPSPAS